MPNINSEINKVMSTRYIGVYLDQNLNWHRQIDYTSDRIRKMIWIFRKLRCVASNKTIKQVYIALVQSLINYCVTIWGGAAKTRFLEVERSQRCLIKVMYCKPFRYPTDDLYKSCQLLSVRKLYILNSTLRLHKTLPYKTNDNIKKRRPEKVAIPPKVRTQFAQRQYYSQSVHIYNKLDKHLKIYPLNLNKCKNIILHWLLCVSYEETESI